MKLIYSFMFLSLSIFIWSCAKDSTNLATETSEDASIWAAIADAEANWVASQEVYQPEATNTRAYGDPIYVKAGSKDELQAAIDAAGINGKVVLKSGMHYESGTVTIDKKITLEGESGAVLVSDVAAVNDFSTPVNPAIMVKGGVATKIRHFEMRPKADKGSTAVLIVDNDFAIVEGMKMKGFQNGVLIEDAKNTKVLDNVIEGPADWFEDPTFPAGMILLNGSKTTFSGNHVSSMALGIFGSGNRGWATDNVLTGNFIGLMLCKPTPTILPDGTVAAGKVSAKKWIVKENEAHYNGWGYLVIDGANNNYVYNNQASNNDYDFELAGVSERFGFLTPTSFKNLFAAGKYQNVSIKDCGNNNQTAGGNDINTADDPCF